MLRGLRTLRLKYRAIIYGCLVSYGVFFGGTILANMVAAAASGDPASLQVARQSAEFMASLFILSIVAPAAGGYLAARLSPRAELTNALAVGAVLTMLALLNPALFSSRPDLLGILGIVLTLPAAFIGGRLRLSRAERSAATG